jgi:hypothetical protein
MKKKNKKLCYISGGMRGIENHKEVFLAAEKELQAQGFKTFNPAAKSDEDKIPGETALQYLRRVFAVDCLWICRHATHIAMTRGWEQSKGACAERLLGIATGLEIIYLPAAPIKKIRASHENHEYRVGKASV